MITKTWMCKNSYVIFKGQIQGIKSIPIFKSDGHCPTLQLNMSYLGKKDELKMLIYKQFKYILKKFQKEIKEKGYEDFILDAPYFMICFGQELTQNLFNMYRELRRLSFKQGYFDWHRTDVKVSLKIELFSSLRR